MITFSSEFFSRVALEPVPTCWCKECDDSNYWDESETEPRRFECEGCKRELPWCYGADDTLDNGESMFDYCDNCAVLLISDTGESIESYPL